MLKTEDILELLKESEADAFELRDVHKDAWEFYFIRHELDQNRVRSTEHVTVKVYRNTEDGMMGSAGGEVQLSDDAETIRKQIADFVYAASLVGNPTYKLNEPVEVEEKSMPEFDIREISENFIRALDEIEETETEDINSYEIFVEDIHSRFVTSTGIDIEEHYPSSMIEVVINARNEKHEIELYRMFRSGTCDKEALKQSVAEAMRFGKDRLRAVPTPAVKKTAVVFSTSDALSLYRFFTSRLSAGMVFRKLSPYKLNEIVAEDIQGDRVTLETLIALPNSSCNSMYDTEGALIREKVLMKDFVPKAYFGDRMFSQYLGIEDSFNLNNWKASGGTKTPDELRTGTFLEVVEFSGFSVDPFTGSIAGEIRMGYFHDDGKVIPVTGGSVSGNLNEYLKNMYMSTELKQYDRAMIPAVTRLEGVSVTGIE